MKSTLALLVTVVLWAAAFPAIRAGLQAYSVGHLVLLRFAVASIALIAIAVVRRAPHPRREDLPRIALLGIIGMTVYPLACSYGEVTVPAGTASILINLSPIFTAILSAVLLRERLPGYAWVGVAIAFSGAALIALGRDAHIAFTSGVAVLIFAAFTQATQFVLTKSLLARYGAVTLTTYSVWAGTIADLAFARGVTHAVTHASGSATAAVLFLGVFSTVIATVTWSYALKRIAAPTAAAFLYLVPPISIVLAWFWLGEKPTPVMIAGGALAICGVAIVKSDGWRVLRRAVPAVLVLAIAPSALAASEINIARVARPPRLDDFATMAPAPDLESTMTRVSSFVQREPTDGAPASQQTDAYLGYDDAYLYAVFVCFDTQPSQIRAGIVRREAIYSDDYVTLQLDTFRDQRRAYEFGVNPHGIQQDAIWVEGSGFDDTFDTVWDSAARLTSRGYVAWMRIPFASLRFPPGAQQSWGVLLTRDIPRLSETVFFPRYSKAITGRLNQMATLTGLVGISPPEKFQFIPYSAYRATRDAAIPIDPSVTRGTAGIDFKSIIKDSIVIDATANPDFSQVESDEPQNAANARFELLVPEKRPFFLENGSYFQTPLALLFTRRIVDPQYGARVTGKLGRTSIGALVANDEVGPDRAMNGVVRLNRELPRQSSVGVILTSHRVGGISQNVLAADTRVKLNENWVTALQAARSNDGHAAVLQINESGSHTEFDVTLSEVSDGFRAPLGFVPRHNVRTWDQAFYYTVYRQGSILQSFQPINFTTFDWSDDNRLLDWITANGVQFNFTRRTFVRTYHEFGTDHVQPDDFPQLGHVLVKPFWHAGVVAQTNVVRWLSTSSTFEWGRDTNFFPVAGRTPESEAQHRVRFTASIRPTPRLTVDNTILEQRFASRAGEGRSFRSTIARSKWNLQLDPRLALRVVAQYDRLAVNQERSGLTPRKNFNVDFLGVWLLHPGTAVYAGYNGNYRPEIDGIDRTFINDRKAVFLKVSYLFRY